jgi:hypothetical protein
LLNAFRLFLIIETAQDYVDRLRADRKAELMAIKQIQDHAMVIVQRRARVWLSNRIVDRLREKYDDAMEGKYIQTVYTKKIK